MSRRAPVADRGILTSRVLADLGVGPQSEEARLDRPESGQPRLAGGPRLSGAARSSCSARNCAPACWRRRRPRWTPVLAELDAADPRRCERCSAAIRARITAQTFPDDIRAAAGAAHGRPGQRHAPGRALLGQRRGFRRQFVCGTTRHHAERGTARRHRRAVLQCLASAYSERSLFYRARRGLLGEEIAAAVIVQVLVDSAVSGVVFSCNPQSGDMPRGGRLRGPRARRGRGLGNGRVRHLLRGRRIPVDQVPGREPPNGAASSPRPAGAPRSRRPSRPR